MPTRFSINILAPVLFGVPVTLGISYGIPLYDAENQLLGVVDADFSLNDLSDYLGRLAIGKTGVAALLSRDGRLLATSDDTAVASDSGQRLSAVNSENPLFAAAGAILEQRQGERLANARVDLLSEQRYLSSSRVGEQVGLDWASAGHGPPIIYDPASDRFLNLDGGGLPLGLMEGEHYEEYTQPPISPGAILFVATDGLEETMNERHEQFGIERLRALVRENARKPAEEISQAIRHSIASYRGAASQADDLTFVVAKVLDHT